MAAAQLRRGEREQKVERFFEHLDGQRESIEAQLRDAVQEIEALPGAEDDAYRAGTHALIGAALDACLAAYGEVAGSAAQLRSRSPAQAGAAGQVLANARALVPAVVREQGARAVTADIGVDVLICRMLAGGRVMEGLLADALQQAHIREGSALARALRRAQGELLEALITAVREASAPARGSAAPDPQALRTERIERALAGEQVSEQELCYALVGRKHAAAIGIGERDELDGCAKALVGLAAELGAQLLCARPAPERLWCWLGAVDLQEERRLVMLMARLPGNARMILGPPMAGREGFAESHAIATEALCLLGPGSPRIFCAASALPALAIARSPLYARWMVQTYLLPLERVPRGATPARAILLAYVQAAGSVSGATRLLGARRRTVERRLRAIEEALTLPLRTHVGQIATALQLERLLAAKSL